MDSSYQQANRSSSGRLATHFAPPGRDTREGIRRSVELVRSTPLLQATIDAIPSVVLILNPFRQIVAANRAAYSFFTATPADLLGKRPGEAVHCVHCDDGPDGCGTGHYCATCGAVEAMLASQRPGASAVHECRLTVDQPMPQTALELRVSATAVELDGNRYTICTIDDISDQKRLGVLNRLFFHDILNTVAGVRYCALLASRKADRFDDELRQLATLVDQLVEEIRGHQDLMLAESGDLEIEPESVRVRELLRQVQALYAGRAVAADRRIRLDDAWDGQIVTDRRLLRRVLGNMLANALEAAAPGETVTLACRETPEGVALSVHNAAVMPEHVRLQIFQRSFSTKAETGRGIGTHSIKLLGERYLGGKVDFESEASQGTTFTILLPKDLRRPLTARSSPTTAAERRSPRPPR